MFNDATELVEGAIHFQVNRSHKRLENMAWRIRKKEKPMLVEERMLGSVVDCSARIIPRSKGELQPSVM